MNEFTLNRNDPDFLQIINTTVNNHSNPLLSHSSTVTNQLKSIYVKLEESLKNIQKEFYKNNFNSNNCNNSSNGEKFVMMSKKFEIFQKYFDEYTTTVYPDSSESEEHPGRKILSKINEGFNESLSVLVNAYTKLNERINDYEAISKSKKKLIKIL